ncbi:MAG: magnesium transporter [Chloroflexota bacterium]|nr:MAG: magnesium transporter [Chloroflexota bacterium]
MVFFSDLVKRPVYDAQNRKVGHIADLVVSLSDVFPRVEALMVAAPRDGRIPLLTDVVYVHWQDVTNLEEPQIYLRVARDNLQPYAMENGELLLGRDIMDKQIVDTLGRRIVKVNDLKLAQIGGVARLIGADISLRAFLRRLGAERLTNLLRLPLPERLITWNYVEPLGTEMTDVKLVVPRTKLGELHPADIADILEQMEADERAAVLQDLSDTVVADAITELEQPIQTSVMSELDSERASDLLEIMPPDDAADILGSLPPEKASELLSRMDVEEARQVQQLLQYPEDTAGGIMTSDVFVLESTLTVDDAIAKLRREAPPKESIYYLFVVDSDERLIGVVSLRDLVAASPQTRIEEVLDRDVVKVRVDDDQEKVAGMMAHYDLLAVPVVDPAGHLLGIVTVDDVLDVVHEEASEDLSQMSGITVDDLERRGSLWKAALARLEWLPAALIGGTLAGVVLQVYAPSIDPLIFFVPLLLIVVATVGGQSLAVANRAISLGLGHDMILREMAISGLVSVVCGLGAGLVTLLWLGQLQIALVMGISLFATLVISATVGTLLPLALGRLEASRALMSAPMLYPVIAALSIFAYVTLATYTGPLK